MRMMLILITMVVMVVTFWAWSPCTRWCTGWGKGRWHSRQGSGHMASWWNETQIDTNKFQNFSLSPYPREDLICFTHFETEKTAFWSPNGTGVSLVNTISLKAFMKRKEFSYKVHEDSVPSYSNLVLTQKPYLVDFSHTKYLRSWDDRVKWPRVLRSVKELPNVGGEAALRQELGRRLWCWLVVMVMVWCQRWGCWWWWDKPRWWGAPPGCQLWRWWQSQWARRESQTGNLKRRVDLETEVRDDKDFSWSRAVAIG